jgi:chromosome partitioning protein
MTRLAVFNQKGGVGKTTTALNLAAAVARRGLRPLLLDLDAQAHLSQILAPAEASSDSVFAYYNESKPLRDLARPVALARADGDRADLVPAHSELMKVDSLFGRGPRILYRLKEGLDEYARADAARGVFIDCCPMLGVLSLSGVFAADKVLVPVSADFLAVKGTLALENTLKALEHVLKKRVARRYVLTRFDSRRKMAHEIAATARTLRRGIVRDPHRGSVGRGEPVPSQGHLRPDEKSCGRATTRRLEELLASGFWSLRGATARCAPDHFVTRAITASNDAGSGFAGAASDRHARTWQWGYICSSLRCASDSSRPWMVRLSTTIPVRVRIRKAYLLVLRAKTITFLDQALKD